MDSDRLLLSGDAPFGDWLEDETLFSLVSRYHRVSGNRLAGTTCKAFFGHARQGSAHDFPCRLDEFASRTEGKLGNTDTLVADRTVLPFFSPFSTAEVIADAVASMRGASIGSLKFRLGLLTSRFGASFPLKACPDCMVRDAARTGLAHWRRCHQLPGVWLCPRHSCQLLQSTLKSTGRERFGWHLPVTTCLVPAFDSRLVVERESLRNALHRLAEAATELIKLPLGFHFDRATLDRCFRVAAFEQGLTARSGRLDQTALAKSYLAVSNELAVVPELAALATTLEGASGQATRVFYRGSQIAHPLRQLVAIVWLFGRWDNFEISYRHAVAEQFRLDATSPNAEAAPGSRASVPTVRAGMSARALAKESGVDVATAMTWLADARIDIVRRPKKMRDGVRQAVLQELKLGWDKDRVASRFDISESTINRLLRTEAGLHSEWLRARHVRSRDAARQGWDRGLSSNPLSPIAVLRAVQPAAYAWLYRNDHAWLAERNSRHVGPAAHGGLIVDWDSRDAALAQQVRDALATLAGKPRSRASLADLIALVPSLRRRLGHLDRLPLTRDVIIQARIGRRWKGIQGGLF